MKDDNQKSTAKEQKKYPWTAKRIAALAGIALLVLMYVITLFAAIFDSPRTGTLFRLCLGMTIFVPIFLWIMIWCIGAMSGHKNFATPNILQSGQKDAGPEAGKAGPEAGSQETGKAGPEAESQEPGDEQ